MKWYYLFLLVMFFLMSCERTSNVLNLEFIDSSSSTLIYEYTSDLFTIKSTATKGIEQFLKMLKQ